MSQVPPQAPMPPPMPPGPDVSSRVTPPAICLIVTGALGLLLQLAGTSIHLFAPDLIAEQQGQEGFIYTAPSGGSAIFWGIVGILMGVVIILGAVKMMKLQSYGIALTASIVALISCVSPCCVITLPFGIWAMVVLCNADVRSAFES